MRLRSLRNFTDIVGVYVYYWTNSAEIYRTYRPWHGVLVDQVSWLWLKIWRRQTADKIYSFEFSKIRISNNFEDKILKKSSK